MARISNIVIFSITTAVIVGIIAICLVAIFINPNRFKADLSQQISRRIGAEVIIHGDINWTWLPWLALHVSDVEFGTRTDVNQQALAHISALALQVQLLPLLHRQLAINSLEIQGIDIHLIKDAQGLSNWQMLKLKPKEESSEKEFLATTAQQSTEGKHHISVNIEQLKIHNAHLDYFDARQNQSWQLENFDFDSQHLASDHTFPIQAQGDLVNNRGAVIHFQLDGSFDPLEKNLNIEHINIANQQLHAQGKALLKSLNDNPKLSVDLHSDNLDLTSLSASAKKQTSIHQSTKPASITAHREANLPISGHLSVKKLKAYSLTLNQVVMQFLYLNDHLQIKPLSAQLYGGNLQASAEIATHTDPLQIICNNQLNNIDIKSLLSDLNPTSRLKLTGIANITSQLVMRGSNTRSLQGQGKLNLTQGTWEGIDIFYYIDMAQALIKKQALPTQNNSRTEIGQMTATFNIRDGVLSNQDLKLQGPQLLATGQGTLDLNQKTIDYRILATRLDESGQPRGQWVPIRITGSLMQPKVALDTEAVLKLQLQKQVEQYKDKISDTLQKNLGKALNSLFK